jgi:hypothetical protein
MIRMSIHGRLSYLIEMFILAVTQTKNTIFELLKPCTPIITLEIKARRFDISDKNESANSNKL